MFINEVKTSKKRTGNPKNGIKGLTERVQDLKTTFYEKDRKAELKMQI